MNWLRKLLAYFAPHTKPALPKADRELIEEARAVRRDLHDGGIVIVTKNQRALAELRRLEGHARR